MHKEIITSFQNPRIKEIKALRDKKDRDRSGLFLIEGFKELLLALESGWEVRDIFFSKEHFLGKNEFGLLKEYAKKGTEIFECPFSLFEKISYRDRPDGLLGIGIQKKRGLKELEKHLEKKVNPFLLIAEGIEKPGNLGTLLRSADAAGVDAVIIADACTDIYNPNVVRASIGTLFHVFIVEGEGKAIREWLRKKKIALVAATPAAKLEFTEANLKEAIAIAVGTEQLGLDRVWMEEAKINVSIPMMGKADSLNVATATTLLLYEALRQRRQNVLPS